jgi:hypothetical protein
MAGLSSSGETTVLNALLATAYVSLHTADPGNTGASEVSGNGYARQGPVAFTASGNNPTVDSNTAVVSFPTATATWGTVTNFGLWTAATAGTFLGGQTLSTARTILANDVPRFLAGALQISAD